MLIDRLKFRGKILMYNVFLFFFISISADLKCSFTNKNTCKWTNGRTDDFEWSLGKSTPSLNTGPNRDHTTRNGELFLFFNSSEIILCFFLVYLNMVNSS